MKLKTEKNYKTERITFRVTEEEKNTIKQRALLYGVNISEYCHYTALKFIVGTPDLEKTASSPTTVKKKRRQPSEKERLTPPL